MLNGTLYWMNTEIPWRSLPERYGPWKSVYTRFRRWSLQGVWAHVFEELIAQDIVDESTLMLDSITIKVHQHGSGAKKGDKAPGRSRGGLSTKIHAIVDGLGNPLRVLLTQGNCNDICYVQKLLEPLDLRGKYIIADKGYDSDRFVRWLEECGAIVVFPSRKIAKHPRDIDRHIYMERHLVESLFLKFKTHPSFCQI